MKFHAFHFNWIVFRNGEVMFILGFATGRTGYAPDARWLYSFRLFLGVIKVELLWKTGVRK